jgi:hypothetical protein
MDRSKKRFVATLGFCLLTSAFCLPVFGQNVTVTNISAGDLHSRFLKANGSLWAMGYNGCGQLGDSTTSSTNRPEQIVSSSVTAIAAGFAHSLFLKADGSLWAMGDNRYGQLGDGTTNSSSSPKQILPSGVIAIGAGYDYSLFLKADGGLWAMGNNRNGQFPFSKGIFVNSFRPVPIAPFPPAPVIHDLSYSGTDLVVHGTNGLAGGTYYVLMSTDPAAPLSQWTRVATNVPVANGAFTITATNAFDPNAERRFYALQLLR